MNNIVMAAAIAQPLADGRLFAANGGANTGGLFGELVVRELELLGGPEKGGEKKAAAGDPLMMLLMAALLPGAALNPLTNEQATESGMAEQQSNGNAIDETAATGNGMQALMKLFAPGQTAVEKEPGKPVSAAESRAAFTTELASALEKLLQGGGQSVEFTGEEARALQTLSQVFGGKLEQAGANRPAEIEPAGNAPAALEEIKRLFNEIIGRAEQELPAAQAGLAETADAGAEEPAMVTAAAAMPTAKEPAPAKTGRPGRQDAAADIAAAPDVPDEKLAQLLKKIETVLKNALPEADGEEKPRAEAAAGPSPDAAGAAEGKDGRQPGPFHAALQAYHAREASGDGVRVGPGAAQAAARPGAEAFESIVESITGMKGSAQKEMEIHLKPSFLGKVVIKLSMDEGGLVAKIAAANPRVQDAFAGQAGVLQSALSEQGLKDVRVVVTSSSVQDPNLQQQADRRGQEQRGQQKKSRIAVEAADTGGGQVMTAYEALRSAGTINYLA